MPRRLSFRFASLLLACGAAACAQAVELGDVRVNSFVGQHLSADIELTSLDDPATPVKVRLASLDVYRGASLDMPAVLASVYMNVVRRDGKQFLHVTSTRPVEADHLHLYLELADGNHRDVRLATLWFSPDPTPPQYVTLASAAASAAPPVALPRKTAPVRPLLESPVPKAKPVATAAARLPKAASPDVMPPPAAGTRGGTHADTHTNADADGHAGKAAQSASAAVQQPQSLPQPDAARPKADAPAPTPALAARASAPTAQVKPPAASAPAATAEAKPPAASAHAPTAQAKPPAAFAPSAPMLDVAGQPARPAPLKLAKTPSNQACRKQALETESACHGLDNKNAELRAEIGKLEARVNSLLAEQNSQQPQLSKPGPKQTASPAASQQLQPGLDKSVQSAAPRPELAPVVERPVQTAERPVQAVQRPGQTASGKVLPARPLSGRAAKPVAASRTAASANKPAAPGMPWGWLAAAGAAVFAVIGAIQFWRHRRKRPKSATVHAPLPDEEDEVQAEPTLG